MVQCSLKSFQAIVIKGEEDLVARAIEMSVLLEDYETLYKIVKFIGVTEQFKDVLKVFPMPKGETPAGFRKELCMDQDGVLRVDLVRDIAYDKNGVLRPTKVLFSADSANPYEVAPISQLISNLTCNPGIVYDLFINNPKANVGGIYKDRDQVMRELAKLLGPGCDVSVELNNPFEEEFDKILEEAEKFKEIFSKYRIVIKVPHTGAVTPENVTQLLEGNRRLDKRYDEVTTENALRGHNLALKLSQYGYRVNFTLMFEPYQTQLALQSKPYFINTFLRHRFIQSGKIMNYIKMYESTQNTSILEDLKAYFIENDYYKESDTDKNMMEVYEFAKNIITYRQFDNEQGSDGLDGMRHNLRVLKNCNMQDTKLIVCSMEGQDNYPAIDKLLTEPEFVDMNHRVVITAEPQYLARFTSSNQVTSYQRRFMNAAKGQK